MTRAPVSVVVPFAGDAAQALIAVALLRSLHTIGDDELILADNCGAVARETAGITVVEASGERSPAHARNAGAAAATCDWILFLDADVQAPPTLLDDYLAAPVGDRVGALVGEIEGAPGARTLAGRYGASRNFLSQSAHLQHPYRPRAAAASLMVRRAAFEQAHGFVEGVRAAEDTDFCWRLQDLGWTLELRPQAVVTHTYRETIGDLRRQWRAYAAGRAWLATRHPGFEPEPALRRIVGGRGRRRSVGPPPPGSSLPAVRHDSPRERLEFLAIDALLAIEELVGLRLSNSVRGGR
jgi:glycosyltransferase involved in cell wall biosynthesis